MKKYKLHYLISILTLPSLTLAFSLEDSTFKGVIDEVLSVINLLIPILVGFAFIYFFWGLSKFILHSDNEKDIEKGKNYMMWGIIALFVLISFRAIISFITSDLELGDGNSNPLLKTNAETSAGSGRVNFPQ